MKNAIATKLELNKETKRILLQHDRTEAEERMLLELLKFLRRTGYSGEIHCRVFIVNQDGKARRPDIYLPRYGLAIEIDGRTRESWKRRQEDIGPRDEFYNDLGISPPLRIDSVWVTNEAKMKAIKYDLEKFIFKNRLTPRKRNTLAKKLCDGRKIFESKYPNIFGSSGTEAPQFLWELKTSGFKDSRHFGGTKFVLRNKYKTEVLREQEFIGKSLKKHCGNAHTELPPKVHNFITELIDEKINGNLKLDRIEDFSRKNSLDTDSFYEVLKSFSEIAYKKSLFTVLKI